jgi:hypothetical protein
MAYFYKKIGFFKAFAFEFLKIKGFGFLLMPGTGDVLKVFFSKYGVSFSFEGLCFRTRFKSFLNPESGLFIFNKINNSSVVFTFSFFYNLIFSFIFSSFKKKQKFFNRSKLSFVLFNKSFFIKP